MGDYYRDCYGGILGVWIVLATIPRELKDLNFAMLNDTAERWLGAEKLPRPGFLGFRFRV